MDVIIIKKPINKYVNDFLLILYHSQEAKKKVATKIILKKRLSEKIEKIIIGSKTKEVKILL